MHLLGSPFRSRIVFVEARQISIVALIERLVPENRNPGLPHLLENEVEGAFCANEDRREGNVEGETLCLELAASGACLGNALLRQINVFPAGEKILEVPLALAMPYQYE